MQPSCVVKLVAFFCVGEWGGGQFGLPWGPPDERFGVNQNSPPQKKLIKICAGGNYGLFLGGAVMSGFEGL